MHDAEHTLRMWLHAMTCGATRRRDVIRAMLAAGLTGPFLADMLTTALPVGAQTPPSLPAWTPQRRGGGGKLRLLWWQAPTILNPHLANGAKDFDAARVVYEPLAAFDAEAHFVPILAAEIPSHANGGLAKDGTAVTWQLKRGVTWHDGTPFTAADVIFTWEFAADPATGAITKGSYDQITHIDQLDDHTITVVFKAPTAFWYDAFFGVRGQILPKHLFAPYRGQASRNAPWNLAPVGTGPYKLVTFKPGDVVLYEINPHYHVPNRPFFDTVELKGGGDAASAARAVLQTGDADYAWNLQVEEGILRHLAHGGKGTIVYTPGANVEHLQINQTDPWTEVEGERSSLKKPHPFQTDPRLRQAYATAIDRHTITDHLYGQGGQPARNYLCAPARFASAATTWEFAPDKAAALLEQAGWTRGRDGIRVRDGQRLAIVFQTSVNAIRQKTQALIKQTFEAIGIAVELKAINASVYFSSDPGNADTVAHFTADVQMYTTVPGSPDPQAHLERFTSWQVAQKANHWSGTNVVRWVHADYDALWKQAETELDPVQRAALYIRMNDMLITHHVIVPLVWRNVVSAASTTLRGMDLSSWDSDLWHLAYWYRDA